MKKTIDIEQSLRKLQAKTSAALDERILSNASAALAQASKDEATGRQSGPWIRRDIMKNNWSKA